MSEEKKTKTSVTVVGEIINIFYKNGYTSFVVKDSSGEYDSIVAFDFKNENIKGEPSEGNQVEMSGYTGSREYQGKYYTNVRGSFCRVLSKGNTSSSEPAQSEASADSQEDAFEDDNVPF